jgi:hypothetical protein
VANLTLVPDPLLEDQEQADLIDKIERQSERFPLLKWLFHVPNGGWRGMRAGRKMKQQGVRPGVPDLVLAIPRGGYFGLWIEMKRQKSVPSDVSAEQRDWHEFLRAQGYCVWVCKGCAHAWRVLVWYMGLPPTIGLSFIDAPPV